MKFGEKYELLESLTTGVVETFAANDRVRGERVLVHIIDCPPPKPEQTTAEWALESFRSLAPEPPGPVLETGKYSGTKYAYVVTKPADEAAAKSWIKLYELHAQETKETKAYSLPTEIAVLPATTPIGANEPAPVPGTMTQLLRDFDSLSKSKPSPPPSPPQDPVSTSLPGGSGIHMAKPWDASGIKPSPLRSESAEFPQPSAPKPAAPEYSFAPKKPEYSFAPEKPAYSVTPEKPEYSMGAEKPEYSVAPEKGNSKPGEFTNFFQGPFRPDNPADVPDFQSQPIEPPQKKVGEFTALFGRPSNPTAAPEPPLNPPPMGTFTSLFRDMDAAKQTFTARTSTPGAVIAPPEPAPIVPAPQKLPPVPEPPAYAAPAAPIVPAAPVIPPTPASSAPAEKPPVPRPSASPGDGATGAFQRPAAEPAPMPAAEEPVGPSPYTQIISRPKMADLEESHEAASAPAASAGKFKAPSMPKIPGAAPPPLPKIPPPPPAPKFAAPKPPAAPKVPKIDAPPPPPVSYWPLVITLTVLFFLAVILVLFFALRH